MREAQTRAWREAALRRHAGGPSPARCCRRARRRAAGGALQEPASTASSTWDDLVKGRIEIGNGELDDLIIARADGTPTYNFCVVVDDWDMAHHAT